MFGVMNCQDGTQGLPNHHLGHASEQQAREAAAAVRAHDDQVDVVFSRVPDNDSATRVPQCPVPEQRSITVGYPRGGAEDTTVAAGYLTLVRKIPGQLTGSRGFSKATFRTCPGTRLAVVRLEGRTSWLPDHDDRGPWPWRHDDHAPGRDHDRIAGRGDAGRGSVRTDRRTAILTHRDMEGV
jgi:hypothetical protein